MINKVIPFYWFTDEIYYNESVAKLFHSVVKSFVI